MLSLFFKVMDCILKKNALPECDEIWQRLPYTRKELEDLCRVSFGMSKEEIKKRIRATAYPGMPGAYIDLFSQCFEYSPKR